MTLSPASLSVSTRTSRDEPTLRISRPSSASSRLSNWCSFCSWDSGLSPSSIGRPAKSGFRRAFRNASAMIAASAPENGVSVEWECEIIEEPSFGEYRDAGRGAGACPINGDCGAAPAPVIMGEADPIEPRREVRALSLRLARRMIRNPRTPIARIAKKPRTTMTAIAQWGKGEGELDCKLPGVEVERALVLEAEAADLAAAEAEAADAEEAEAAAAEDEDAMEDVTESANVVSARGWSIRGQDTGTKTTLTNCSERRLRHFGAIQRRVRTSYYPIIRI